MMKKILSVLLVAVMLFGSVVALIPERTVWYASAEETLLDYQTATNNAVTLSYATLAEKLNDGVIGNAPMLAVKADNGTIYHLYCNKYTGEVIYYNTKTGEAVTTNPYDMGASEGISATVKQQLMSQITISYKGKDGNLKTMHSFVEAAQRGQIQVKSIKNGIRVQYVIGRENADYLMPGWITVDRFQEEIIDPLDENVAKLTEEYEAAVEAGEDQARIDELKDAITWADFYRKKVLAAYKLQDPNSYTNSAVDKKLLAKMQTAFPITAKKDATGKFYAIYTVDDSLTDVQKNSYEVLIRTYCPDYTYDDLAADNTLTGYVSKSDTPPVFKLSLEYTINTSDGSLDIRLPANSILYDETLFQLESISTLPFLGAGSMSTSTYGSYFADQAGVEGQPTKGYVGNAANEIVKDGYVFYPDGSGAIFQFADLYTKTKQSVVSWSGKVYGQDYAYYTITGQNQEPIRLPVYGVVSTTRIDEVPLYEKNPDGTDKLDSNGNKIQALTKDGLLAYDLVPVQSGFLAILEEGEAMTNLSISFGATRHNYASAHPIYYPRPKDTYDLSDSLSVSGNTEWTIVADRKYTGNYRTRVIMLSDSEDDYAPTWVGMATAYRYYLDEVKDVINPLTIEQVEEQIPLYIETFGAYETTQQILSMPIDVKVPLTSFADVSAIYNDLRENAGIYNINFKLTGFANGGMKATYPAKLSWEGAVGGNDGFRKLIAEAKEKGFGIYPEFDFTYISNEALFDGVSLKGLGARTVDNRYCSKQIYDAVYQQFISYFDMCVSTSVIGKYYSNFSRDLSKYMESGSFGISVGTLGSDLNSNFDEEDPINREEAKEDVANLLASMKSSYKSLMLNGGNEFTLKYADHLVNMPLSGSNFRYASASVPFMAMVLHGYISYAGSAINMSGDTDFQLLKTIENGASPYFLLSYNTTNTMLLKKDESLNKYYSIRYDIWRWADPDAEEKADGAIVTQYKEINSALADLQTAVMIDHAFLRGERILKDYEIADNKRALSQAVVDAIIREIAEKENSLLESLRESLGLYSLISDHDQGIRDTLAGYEDKSQTIKETRLKNYIKKYPELSSLLNGQAFTALGRAVADAYTKTGTGLEALLVIRGLRTVSNTDLEALWQSVVLGVRDVFTEEELAELRVLVEETVAAYSQTGSETLFGKLTTILGATPTANDVALFNRMIYADVSEDAAKTMAADGFTQKLDAEKAAAVAALVDATRKANQVLVVANEVAIDFNFNTTGSFAEDGPNYADTDYTLDDERIVLVTYRKQDGSLVKFILNYNIFAVTIKLEGQPEPIIVDSYGWIRIDIPAPGGEG